MGFGGLCNLQSLQSHRLRETSASPALNLLRLGCPSHQRHGYEVCCVLCGPLQLNWRGTGVQGPLPGGVLVPPDLGTWAHELPPSCNQCGCESYPTEQSQGGEWCVML